MLVHHHEPGITAFPARSRHARPAGTATCPAAPTAGIIAASDHDRLAGPRWRAGTVDHAHVRERDDRVGDRDELANALSGLDEERGGNQITNHVRFERVRESRLGGPTLTIGG